MENTESSPEKIAKEIQSATIEKITNDIKKILIDNGIEVGFVSFIVNDEPIIALHGDFYESVKLVCQGSEKIKRQVINDLRIAIPGRT